MMSDPREAKLPVWARELLETERLRAALAWPTEPDPEPRCVMSGASGQCLSGNDSDGEVWVANAHRGDVRRAELRARHLYFSAYDSQHNIGSRPDGALYGSESDARTALRWAVARDCAKRLRAAGN